MGAVQIELSDDARDFQRRNWSALVSEDPAGTFFHLPAFLKLYWEEFGDETAGLLLAFGEHEGDQVGAVGFERDGETLRFLGGTEITDYLGPVAAPAHKAAFAEGLWDALLARDDWARADLWGLAQDAGQEAGQNPGWYDLLGEAASARGLTVREEADHDGVAPILPLPATWDSYLEGLPAKLRHEIRRKAKKLEADGGPFRIVTAGTEDLTTLLDRFVELHRLSEGPKGVFMIPGMEIFFRRLGEAFLSSGAFRLNFIEVNGELAAGTIGFRWQEHAYLYNSAFDRAYQPVSPGMVLVAEDIRVAIEAGCSAFDMLKGDYAYKYRFGAVPRAIKRLVVTR